MFDRVFESVSDNVCQYIYVPYRLHILREYRVFYRALLQKKPMILRGLLIVATQYVPYHLHIVQKPCRTHSLTRTLSFAEYRLFCGALLQKRPIILRSLLVEATP